MGPDGDPFIWTLAWDAHAFVRQPLHARPYALLRSFPDDAGLDELARLEVLYVVVHTELYPPGEWPRVAARIDRYGSRLRLEHVAGTGRIYSLHPLAPQ
jgi:hypothetical protein